MPLFHDYRRVHGQDGDIDLAREVLAARLAGCESYILLATGRADRHAQPLGFAQLCPMYSSVYCQLTLVLHENHPHAIESRTAMNPASGFARRFLPVWSIGLLGVASLLMQEPPTALFESVPSLRELPAPVVRLMLLLNPLILVTVMAAVGAAVAQRAGLRSVLAGSTGARLGAPVAVVVGLVLALILMAIDAAVAERLGPGWSQARSQADSSPWLPTMLLGVLYGGLAEEVIMRWGVMSLVVWCVLRLQRLPADSGRQPSIVSAWVGIVVAAAIFAIGHLPALAQSVALSGPIVARTVGLNLLAGLAYGWLFWRRSLESAMLAHATTHIGFALGRWLA